jgi:LuxR family transcriptional regulator, maltose regulon positive regulatory protein
MTVEATSSEPAEHALATAFRSGDRAHCIALIGENARVWLKAGEVDSVARWARRLSRNEILHNEAIATSYIASLIFRRRFLEATTWLQDVEHNNVSATEVMRSRLRTLRLMLGAISENTNEEALIAEVGEGPGDGYLSGALIALQAYALIRKNRFDAAKRRALRAKELLAEHGDAYGASYAEVLIIFAQRLSGDLIGAAASCERLFASVAHCTRNPAWVNAASTLAHLRYEQNRMKEAHALCEELLPLLRVASTPEVFASVYITRARLAVDAGRTHEAMTILETLHSAMEDGRHGRLVALCVYERVRTALLADDADVARRIAAEAGIGELAAAHAWARARTYDPAWERLGQAHAILLLHERRIAECRTLLQLLIKSAAHAGCLVRVVGLEALLATCEWLAGERIQAFAALNRAHARTRAVAFVRSVFDEAPGFAAIMRSAVAEHALQLPLPDGYIERWCDVLGGENVAQAPAAPVEPLTERELRVLTLVAEGLRNDAISARLQIALSTTKWHMQNIFAKLGVASRTEALVRARRLNIIGS